MIKRICRLTKSYKGGGYCVAGVDFDTKRFIRLVKSEDPEQDSLTNEIMSYSVLHNFDFGQLQSSQPINCFDVVDAEVIRPIPINCQTENYLIDTSIPLKFINSIPADDALKLISPEESELIICNKNNKLNPSEIKNIDRSLFLYYVENLTFQIFQNEYGSWKNTCSFIYNGNLYDSISMTDPRYRHSENNGITIAKAAVIMSLPVRAAADGFFYKFVANVIELNDNTMMPTSKTDKSRFVKLDLASSNYVAWGDDASELKATCPKLINISDTMPIVSIDIRNIKMVSARLSHFNVSHKIYSNEKCIYEKLFFNNRYDEFINTNKR